MAAADLHTRDASRDAGFIVSWLVRLVVVLVITAVALFEVAGVLIARVTASDTATKAAEEAGFVYRDKGDIREAEAAARAKAEAEGASFDAIAVDPQARTMTVTVHKNAKTLLIQHIGAFKKYLVATAKETTPLPS